MALDQKQLLNIEYLKRVAEEYSSEPFWFGLGFIQLKLSDTERMHFWTPAIPRRMREEIHNHRYGFNSTVLAGMLVFQTFHHLPSPDGAYELFQTNCKPNCKPSQEGIVETVTPCHIWYTGFYKLRPGSIYSFPHHQFHTTEETCFAITHLVRPAQAEKEFADVIKVRGEGTSCPFKEKVAPETCWNFIEQALRYA